MLKFAPTKHVHLDMISQNVSTEKGALSWYVLPAKCRTGESGGSPTIVNKADDVYDRTVRLNSFCTLSHVTLFFDNCLIYIDNG